MRSEGFAFRADIDRNDLGLRPATDVSFLCARALEHSDSPAGRDWDGSDECRGTGRGSDLRIVFGWL